MSIEPSFALLESILAPWQARIGRDYPGYRNHVYRVIHFCFALRECTEQERRKIIIAAGFHDLGIWSHETVDYLPPSMALAREYLQTSGLEAWVPEIDVMIGEHHKLRPVKGDHYPLVEVFRRGDLVDFSMGLLTAGVPKSYIREVQDQYPNAGFHKQLGRMAWGWFARHPFSPPPFMKW